MRRSIQDILQALEGTPGLIVQNDDATQTYPMPVFAEGKDEVFVGRVRKDRETSNGYHLWIVSDNLLKGAALNSVQIAESLIKM